MNIIDNLVEIIDKCVAVGCHSGCPFEQRCLRDNKQFLLSEALHYLKEYQKIEDEYEELKDWWAEEHAENVPLSWDELKQMEGKPVWYEHEFWKGWIILGKVEQGVNCEMIPDREERWYIVKDGSAKAYRKERK